MPWAGGTFTRNNGTYSGSTVWQSDAAAAIKIRADRHDTHDQDIAQGINNCLTKDGQNSPTQHISWGGFKVTNLGNGTAASDAAAYGQTITALGWSGATITATRAAGNLTLSVTAANITSALTYTPLKNTTDTLTGDLTVSGFVQSSAVGGFVGSSHCVLATTGAATISLRPNGAGSTTGQLQIDSSGNGSSGGQFTFGGFVGTGNAFVATTGANSIFLRPNGIGSTTNQATYNSSGNLTIGGQFAGSSINVGSGFTVTKVTVSSSAPGTLAQGEIYFRTT